MKNRRGFTLIEVMIAMIILTIISIGVAKFVATFLHTVGTTTAKTVATAVAQEQVETIRADPSYTTLVATYNGNSVTGFPGYAAMNRTTRVVRTQGNNPTRDYTTITVQVSEPTMGTPVNVTIVIAAP